MQYEARPPRAELEPFVRCLWRLRGDPSEIEPQQIIPDGCFELIVHLGEPLVESRPERAPGAVYAPDGGAAERGVEPSATRQERALLAATLTRTVIVAASGDVDVIGVRFHPGRAYPFLAVAPWEIVDRVAPALDVIARELVALPSRLDQGGATDNLFAAVEGSLLARLARVGSDTRFDRMASALIAIDGPAVTRLANAAGVSLRQFERLFKSRAGVSAKVLQRVVRFHRVASRLLAGARADADLATLALDGGFFDQAHMSHEFRALADVSPSRYPQEAGVLDRLFAESRARGDA